MFTDSQIQVAKERACRALNVDELEDDNEAHLAALKDELRRIAIQKFVDLAVEQGKIRVAGVNEQGEVLYEKVEEPDEL